MRNQPGLMALATALGLASILAISAARAADTSIEARLKAGNIQYDVDDDGDYKITYSYEDEGRTQLVYVSGTLETISDMNIIEIFAPAGKVDADHIDGAMALKLLGESQMKKFGSWELSGNTLLYVIKLPESVNAATLEAAIKIAADVADTKEIELSGKKDAL